MHNEMMNRPLVDESILNFMRTQQNQLHGILGEIEEEAHHNNNPIIPHETVVFFQFLLGKLPPKNILEVGTAIGFSASLFASLMQSGGHVTTIDRYDQMRETALRNFKRMGISEQVTLIAGDAADVLPELTGMYDFVFLDAAKAQYIHMLPFVLKHLTVDGTLAIDDVLQAGTVFNPIDTVPRRQRGIHRNLNRLLNLIYEIPELQTSLLPLGDGLLLVTKKTELSSESINLIEKATK